MKWREVLRMPVSEATRLGAEQMARLLRTDVRDLFAGRTEVAGDRDPRRGQVESVVVRDESLGGASAALAVRAQQEARSDLDAGLKPQFSGQPGEVVDELFAIVSELPRRGSVHLYRARHLAWEKEVWLAVPDELSRTRSGEGEWFGLASRWSACGLHPYLQYCFEARVWGGTPYLVLEPLEGASLRAWISAGRCQPLRVAFDLAIQLCLGLAHAHERGLFHGALSPDCAWVDDSGILRIGWFGLSFPRDTVVEEAYVAPERWVDEESPDLGADVFGLGVCLYELLCGQRPYEITRGPRREAAEPGRRKGDSLPEAVASILRACVDWEPLRRPQSVGEVAAVLCAAYQERFATPSPYAYPDTRQIDAAGWNNQGMVAIAAGRAEEAEAAWETALAHDRHHLEAGFNLAMSRWRRGVGTDREVLAALARGSENPRCPWRQTLLAALVHIEAGDAFGAKPCLERAAPFLAGKPEFEDLLRVARRARPPRYQGRELKGHRQFVSAVGVSADGRWIVSGSDDHTVVVWDGISGNPVRILEGHEKRVSCLALTPDATRVLSGSEDFTLQLWDVQRGRTERRLGLPGQVFAVALSADARRAVSSAAGSDNFLGIDGTTVAFWDLERERILRVFEDHTSAVKAVALTPDGRYLATGSDDQTVRLWDTATGRCIRVLRGHTHNVSCVALSADGKYVVSGSWDRTVRLWEGRTGRCLAVLSGHEGIVTALCVDPEAKIAVSGSWDGSVRVWDLESKRCIRAYSGHDGLVTSVALAASAQLIVSGGWDHAVRLWDLPQPGPMLCQLQLSLRPALPPLDVEGAQAQELLAAAERAIEQEDLPQAISFIERLRPFGSRVAGALRALEVRLLPSLTSKALRECRAVEERGLPVRVQASDARGGTLLVLSAENELLYEKEGELHSLGAGQDEVGPIRAVALSPSGERVAYAGLGRTVAFVSTSDPMRARFGRGHTSLVAALCWCGEQAVASASYDGTVRVWDAPSGDCRLALEGHEAGVRCLAAVGGLLASGDWNGEMRIWELATGRCVATVRVSDEPLRCLAFVGEEWLVVGTEAGSIFRYALSHGELQQWQGGHGGAVLDICPTWDGRRLLTAGADGKVAMWNVASGACEAVLCEGAEAVGQVFFPRGASRLVTVRASGALVEYELIWDFEVAERTNSRSERGL